MPSILDKLKENGNGNGYHPTVSDKQREKFPTLAGLLEGTSTPDAQGKAISWSVTLWADDGAIRFAIGSRALAKTFYGSAGADVKIGEAIEKALEEGAVTAKREKEVFGGAKY